MGDLPRKGLSCAIVVAMIAVSFPSLAVSKPELPRVIWVEAGGELYRFDYSHALENLQAWMRSGEGCLDVVVEHAVDPSPTGVTGFAFGEDPSPDAMTVLTEPPSDVAGAALDPVLTHRLCHSANGMRFEQFAGPDRMTWEFPVGVLVGDAPAGETIRVTANGHVEEIDPATLFLLGNRLAQGDDPTNEPVAESFGNLFWKLRSPSTLVNAFYGFLWASKAFESIYEMPYPVLPNDCIVPCSLCAVYAILFLTVGPMGLAAGCSAAVATGGILTPACIAAFGGYVALAASTTGSCYGCGTCLGPGGPPPKNECPSGYHECCERCCCSNESPPETCGPCP